MQLARAVALCLLFVPVALAQAPEPVGPAAASPVQNPPRALAGGSSIAQPQSNWTDIVAHTRSAVVVIETDKGQASGFIIKICTE